MKASKLELLSTPTRTVLQVTVDSDYLQQARAIYDELHDKDIDVSLKAWRDKRSLDANAYAWVLIGQLAAKLNISPIEVYRAYIPDVGGNYKVVPVQDNEIEEWRRLWCDGHIGRQIDDLGECRTIKGFHNLRCYIGSSDYDTEQMSRLIDMIIADCQENGIETKTQQELVKMIGEWDGR